MFGDSSERTGALCGVVKLGSSSPVFFIFYFILEFFPQFKNGEKPLFPILSFLFRSISQAVAILIRQAKKSFRKARAAYGGTRLGRAVFRIRATKVPIARNTF
jgi:hypothetical protein